MNASARVLVSLLAAIAALAATAPRHAPPSPLPGDSVYQLPAQLTDSNAVPLAWGSLRGKPRIATMFYTSCQYLCPLVVDSIRSVERGLTADEQARIGFVLISMDPGRDTPEKLAQVMTERRLDGSRWLLLRPQTDDLRGLAGILGVRFRELSNGEFNHTATLVLLDADGRVLARTDRIGGNGDAEFLAAVHVALASR